MGIKDIVDKAGVNIDYTKIMGQLAGAISSSFHTNGTERMRIDSNGNASFPNWQDVLMNEMDKGMITIKNPEKLNTNGNPISGEWGIEYFGRDLSLNKDNYRWDIHNAKTGVKGYYIVERELIQGDWLNIRWNRIGMGNKEMRELIDKKRLRDRDMIQRDMIVGIITKIGHNG